MKKLTALVILLSCPPIWAQTSRASLSGNVTDPSGAIVVTAKVQLTIVDQNVVRNTDVNSSGVYQFDAVDPGNYKLKVTANGFSVYETRTFLLTGAQVATIDPRLEVGAANTIIEVAADAVLLQTEAPARGGTIAPTQATQLPIASRNPVSLALTLPGVSTSRGGFGQSTFVVNGGRGRSNNFMLDGTENNDISVAGQAFEVTNTDAVREVSVQTSNFDAEFGRAGGAVVNTITKSGSNAFHGTAGYLAESTRLNAITNQEALNADVAKRGHPLPGTEQWFSGTLGGRIIKDKTFFFVAHQDRRQLSSSTVSRTTVSAAGRAKLRSLFAAGVNKNVDNYLTAIGSNLATTQFSNVDLGSGRGLLETGTVVRAYAQSLRNPQTLFKIDHTFNDRNFLMGRYAFDQSTSPTGGALTFDGFDTGNRVRNQNAMLSYTRIISPTITNELRLPYNRITLQFPNDAVNPAALTLPSVTIQGFAAVGVASNIPQGRIANNYGIQDSVSIIRGTHSFRMGADVLAQRAVQAAPFAVRGALTYNSSTGSTSWANYIDDFGGSGGNASRDFGSPKYYPSLVRTALFGQDRWRVSDALTLTLGLRYESFGLPMNSIRTPAYAGLFNINPASGFTGPFSQPNRVQSDKNNFSPVFGLAWSPKGGNGMLGKLLGEKKTVWRMGYQVGYDSFFNNIASNALSSSPNLLATSTPSTTDSVNPRGRSNFLNSVPSVPRAVLPTDSQTLMLANLRNPYYQRWSGGFQRSLAGNIVLDVSYVGSKGTRLFLNEDLNPQVPTALRILPAGVTAASVPYSLQGRLDNLQGNRTIRTNGGSSKYHALQIDARRRFANGLSFSGAYTWSKTLDNGSEIFAFSSFQNSSLPAVPSIFGGQARESGLSAFDRTQRASFTWVYDLPMYKSQQGIIGRTLGGWQVSGVTVLESGVPLSIVNGVDADGFGGAGDRPDFNPNGQPGVRAVVSTTSPTGYVNPDAANAPITAASAMYIQLPACNVAANPSGCRTGNLGRNTFRSPGLNNFNVNLLKTTNIYTKNDRKIATELRAEFFNFFNHPQYGSPGAGAFQPGTPALVSSLASTFGGRFLNPAYMDGGARAIRLGLKVTF